VLFLAAGLRDLGRGADVYDCLAGRHGEGTEPESGCVTGEWLADETCKRRRGP
jgi:hypothetical protein